MAPLCEFIKKKSFNQFGLVKSLSAFLSLFIILCFSSVRKKSDWVLVVQFTISSHIAYVFTIFLNTFLIFKTFICKLQTHHKEMIQIAIHVFQYNFAADQPI